ncbi:MAG: phosphonate C-P lyase system protein PhnH [Alphaproteobacteria bacterium]
MSQTALKAGFDDSVHDSQRAFRALLDAMARPGRIATPPAPPEHPAALHTASAAVCLALLDFETPLWLAGEDVAETRAWLAFHAGCPFAATPGEAAFALVTDARFLPPLDSFALGSDEMPERSTTLLLEVGGLDAGRGKRLSGPGIDGSALLAIDGLCESFWVERAAACALFPRGLDMILSAGAELAALPRTARVED